jgi:hypothetical protein
MHISEIFGRREMIRTSNSERYVLLSAALVLLMVSACVLLAGCPNPNTKPGQNGREVKPEAKVFAWDSVRRTPRWRMQSSIGWMKDRQQAIEAARTSGKPILAYVSRYDSGLTGTIEAGILQDDTWAPVIKESFVPWEVEWWEDPALALEILGSDSAPALVALKVSPEAGSNELRRVDIWNGRQIVAFPLHGAVMPVPDIRTAQRLAAIASADWATLSSPAPVGTEIDPDAFVASRLNEITANLASDGGLMPEEVQFVAFNALAYGTEAPGLTGQVSSWSSELTAKSVDGLWLPDKAFANDLGWSIDPARNLLALECAPATGLQIQIAPDELNRKLKAFIELQDGNMGGGFPAFFDVRNTYMDGPAYMADDPVPPADVPLPFTNAAMGPRDIVWVNARMLTLWLRLAALDGRFAEAGFPDTSAAAGFLPADLGPFVNAILTKAGEPDGMKFADKVYVLGMLNELYQYTADVEYLEKAGAIASTFPVDSAETWFDPKMFPLLPDLAMNLFNYGWLAEDEVARASAKYITESAIRFTAVYPKLDGTRMAYAQMLVHSPSIHASVIAPEGDPQIAPMMRAGFESGWDPRRMVQMLDPARDAQLIEKKGYTVMDQAVTFICIDTTCYPPSHDAQGIKETLAQVIEDLRAENEAAKKDGADGIGM